MDELAKEIEETLRYYAPTGSCTLSVKDKAGFLHVTRIPNPDFIQPPVLFEESLGLSGVSAKYSLFENTAAAKLENYVLVLEHAFLAGDITQVTQKDRLSQIWQGLVGRNPALEDISFDDQNPSALQTVIRGVASAYLPRDIGFFVSLSEGRLAEACKDKNYEMLYKKVCAHIGDAPRWLPAVETMKSIEQQMGAQKLRAFHAQKYDYD